MQPAKLKKPPPGKTWKEVNKERREKRKQKNEEQLVKKARVEEEIKKKEEEKKINEVKKVSTLSVALPGSILDNAQSPELRAYLAGQIARAACIYKIDEVIVYDDKGEITEVERKKMKRDCTLGDARPCCLQLGRILQYLECPQYLRKHLFPIHKDLQYAGLLNPLDAPHHLRQQDVYIYREGVITNKPVKAGKGSMVYVGLQNDVRVDEVLTSGTRVTVKIPTEQEDPKKPHGIIVSAAVPRADTGIYWGYSVRLAANLSEVFAKCPYRDGYDMSIGTSDKGTPVDSIAPKSIKYKHALIVFGGLSGIESAVKVDPNINDQELLEQKKLFWSLLLN
ncbi:hypothetical protein TKK_0008969 [Trichogramma kaykai]